MINCSVSTLIIVAATVIVACSSTTAPGSVTPAMTCSKDGTLFTAATTFVVKNSGITTVNGTGLTGQVSIAFPDTLSLGSHAVGLTIQCAFVEGTTPYSTVYGGSGTVNITRKDATSITGTFSFTGYSSLGGPSRVITAGQFAANY